MSGLSHCFHLIMTIIFFPWIFIWVICAVSAGNSNKKMDREMQARQTAALEELARVNKWKGWNDK